MKKLLVNFLVANVLLTIISSVSFACSCAPPLATNKTLNEIRKEKRSYFLNEFSGAAFVGQIINRERENVNWIARTLDGKPAISQMYKYTIRMKEYWLGVKMRTIAVWGEPEEEIFGNSRSGSSCGFKLSKGKTYFFTPGFYENHLTIDQCDFAGGGSSPNEGRAAEFRNIMGEPKRF